MSWGPSTSGWIKQTVKKQPPPLANVGHNNLHTFFPTWGGGGQRTSQFPSWTPYQTPQAPQGYYDPNLDAQLGQAQRGFGDLQTQLGTANERDAIDMGLGVDQVNQQTGWSQADLDQQVARGQQDYNQQDARNLQDYNSQTATLHRAFQQLAGQQAEGDRHAGVLSSGVRMLQANRRAANQAIEQQPLDTGYQRASQDVATARGRMFTDASTQSGRLHTTAQNQIGQLQLGVARNQADRGLQLDQGQRELGQFGIDTEAQKAYQATQLGWSIPAPGQPGGQPLNEHTAKSGQTYHTVTKGGFVYSVLPNGKVLSKRKAKK